MTALVFFAPAETNLL